MAGIDTIRRKKVFEEVAATLQTWILAELKPGDRLPPERELMATFGVGRSSIRDALQRLQQQGFVETRHGIGSVVAEPARRAAVVPITSVLHGREAVIAELMDLRRILEPPITARAAARADDSDVAALKAIFERQVLKTRRALPAVEEDAQFHYAIATAAKNSLVVKVLDTLMSLLKVTREQQFQNKQRCKLSLEGHRRILAAVEARRPDDAAAAMEQHLDEVEAAITPVRGGRKKRI